MADTDGDGIKTIVKHPGASISTSFSANVSAVITYQDGTIKSLGMSNHRPYFRGRNLLLEYHNGSPCVGLDGTLNGLRMSTLISFKCDHDIQATHAGLSFLGSPDNCSYFFEARSVHACPSTNQEQSMAPVPIFLIIFSIAVLVWALASILLAPYSKNSNTNNKKNSSNFVAKVPAGLGLTAADGSYIRTKESNSILPLSIHDISNHEAINNTNFVFPYYLSFMNPLLYRLRRLRYTPEKSSQMSPDGETVTVFEALTPGKGSTKSAKRSSSYYRRSNGRVNSGDSTESFPSMGNSDVSYSSPIDEFHPNRGALLSNSENEKA